MGYRATVMFDLDHLDTLKSNVDKLISSIKSFGYSNPKTCNAAIVLEKEHADISKLVIIGNHGDFVIEDCSLNAGIKSNNLSDQPASWNQPCCSPIGEES